MANSEKPTSGKCFSGILRRILCSGSIPTHPSNEFSAECQAKKVNHPEGKEEKGEASKPSAAQPASTPGVVARLMGLESLPDVNLSPKTRTFGSFLRSRSVDSIDYLPTIDLTNKLQHRRVKTLTSFCEVPDDHLLIVRFEKTNEEKEEGSRNRKPVEMSHRQGNQKRVVQSKVNGNNVEKFTSKRVKESKRVDIRSSIKVEKATPVRTRTRAGLKDRSAMKPLDSREASVRLGFNKLRKNRRYAGNNKLQPRCHTHITKHSPLRRQVTEPGNSKPTCRKKCPRKFTKFEGPLCHGEEPTGMTRNLEKPVIKSFETDNFTKMLTDIYRLSADDINGAPWIARQELSFEDLEEMCLRFGQHIFEVLLDQIVDELLVIHMMK